MKKIGTVLTVMLLFMTLFVGPVSAQELKIITLSVGQSTEPMEAKGVWKSDNPSVAIVDDQGVITALKDGYANIFNETKKGHVYVRCEVQVGEYTVPSAVEQIIFWAIGDWNYTQSAKQPRYNKYTQWYNPAAKDGFGWCGAFVGYFFDQAGVPMTKEFKASQVEPMTDGSLVAVRQASQTKLWEGFQSRNRITHTPRPGYYIIYGMKGSTPYTHVGLVTDVISQGDGVYILQTIEGNAGTGGNNGRIQRFCYIYDAYADKKENNITSLPQEMRLDPNFEYEYVDKYYLNCFGQTWY